MLEREREFIARQREILTACGFLLRERGEVWRLVQSAERGVAEGVASLWRCLEGGGEPEGESASRDRSHLADVEVGPEFERELLNSLRAEVAQYASNVDRCARAVAHAQAELSALDSAQQALRGRLRAEMRRRLGGAREREEGEIQAAREKAEQEEKEEKAEREKVEKRQKRPGRLERPEPETYAGGAHGGRNFKEEARAVSAAGADADVDELLPPRTVSSAGGRKARDLAATTQPKRLSRERGRGRVGVASSLTPERSASLAGKSFSAGLEGSRNSDFCGSVGASRSSGLGGEAKGD